jgi:hypothetical protein
MPNVDVRVNSVASAAAVRRRRLDLADRGIAVSPTRRATTRTRGLRSSGG